MTREIELKLACDPEALARVQKSPAVAKLKKGRARKRSLRSTYFDTQDFALLKHGIALRLRENGSKRIQTLKTENDGTSLANDRKEYETVLSDNADRPDLNQLPAKLRERIRKLTGNAPMLARVVTDIDRIESQLRTADGDEIELAMDRGSLQADGRRKSISEVELELKQGDPASLYELALKLADSVPLRVTLASKSERGLALAQQREPEIVKAQSPAFDEDNSVEEAFSRILRQCLVHLISNERPALEQQSVEGMHQMRVALRRFLSALALFKHVAHDERLRMIAMEAKWLAESLGQARDLDVFLTTLAHLKEKSRPIANFEKVEAAASSARDEAWSTAVAAIHSARYTRFVLRLSHYIAAKGWRSEKHAQGFKKQPLPKFAGRALDKLLVKICDLASGIEHLDIEERHSLRKRLKKLRYSVGFFASLYREADTRRYLHDLAELQDVFGSLNDAAVGEALLFRLTASDPSLKKPAALLTASLQRRAEKDWHQAQRVWRKFSSREPFWR